MITLVAGGNGSGKSRFAESLIDTMQGPRIYIATMDPQNEENRARIEKHRLQRADLHFTTVEEPWQVSRVPVPQDAAVLLEDVSNLLGNLLFVAGGRREQALEEIRSLAARCANLVLVTISGLEDSAYDGETAAYIRDIRWLNGALYALSDRVLKMQNGAPVQIK